MALSPFPAAQPANRAFSLLDQMKRIQAMPHIEDFKSKSPPCSTVIHIGIFFDGTNNNKERDQIDVKDPNARSHSNVVVLHDAFRDDPDNGYYKFYIPGVGTRCEQVGELKETPSGKSMATGGDARINWALLQLLNAMHRSMLKRPMFEKEEATQLATTSPLHYGYTPRANMEGKREFFTGGVGSGAGGRLAQLQKALEAQGPQKKLVQVNLSVFGFSRGAAQARAFCHFLHHILLEKAGDGYTLAGVPLRIPFLGLFDTVGSVGMADASPFWRGLGGWANGTQAIVPSVRRVVHLCAAHEIRINFPLSSARDGRAYPPGCIERVYPGAHSDVGGGYPPGSQGKAVGSRTRLLSQVPLLDMYREALLAMVPVLTIEQLKADGKTADIAADFELAPECIEVFNTYRGHAAKVVGGSVEDALHGHTRIYWRWRLAHLGAMNKLPSYGRANRQDQVDIWESDSDFASDVVKALAKEQLERYPQAGPRDPEHSMDPAQRDFVKERADMLCRKDGPVPPVVGRFFDELMHDSHASFYMVGPVAEADRKEKIAQIERKLAEAQRLIDNNMRYGRSEWTPERIEKARMASLSDLERRIYRYQKDHPGQYPETTDADRAQLLAMEDLGTRAATEFVTSGTRRELGGHVRYRRVFDDS